MRDVFLRLLHLLAGPLVAGLGFDHANAEIRPVAEDVLGPFAGPASPVAAHGHNPGIGEVHLLVQAVRFVLPAGGLELWHHVAAASVGFVRYFGLQLGLYEQAAPAD